MFVFCPKRQPVTPCRILGEETAGAWQPATVFEMKRGDSGRKESRTSLTVFLGENTPGARQPVTVFWLKRRLVARGMLEAY